MPSVEDWAAFSLNTLEVQGHLEGELRGVRFGGDTTDNGGFATNWQEEGFLDLNIAARGESESAGMILLTLGGGSEHPLLRDGHWSSREDWLADFGGSPRPTTWVGSCTGPDLGDWPEEASPVEYEIFAEPVAGGRVSIEVEAQFEHFEVVTATFELNLPE